MSAEAHSPSWTMCFAWWACVRSGVVCAATTRRCSSVRRRISLAEPLDNVEVENFPTLLIARGDRVLFFGTVTPHAQTLTRLVQGALAGELESQTSAPEIDALARRVAAWCRLQRADAQLRRGCSGLGAT